MSTHRIVAVTHTVAVAAGLAAAAFGMPGSPAPTDHASLARLAGLHVAPYVRLADPSAQVPGGNPRSDS